MRLAILMAAFGVAIAAPVVAPNLAPAAHAQAAVATAEERALEAQIVALAQAGDLQGVRALLAAQVRAGKSAVLARVARRVAVLAEQIAATDPEGSAALVNAAVVVVSNPSVSAADTTASAAVGASAQNVVSTVQTSNPSAAASVQTTVAVEGNADVQISYTAPPTTTPTVPNSDTPVVVRPPIVPVEPVVPVIVEPNPAQTGSPT